MTKNFLQDCNNEFEKWYESYKNSKIEGHTEKDALKDAWFAAYLWEGLK